MNFDLAACRPSDPYTATTIKRLTELLNRDVDVWDLFFPPSSDHPDAFTLRQAAVGICRTCPLMWECGEWAVRNGDFDGIHGGLSRPEKHELGRRLRLPNADQGKCGTYGGAVRHRRDGEKPCRSCASAEYEANRQRKLRRAG